MPPPASQRLKLTSTYKFKGTVRTGTIRAPVLGGTCGTSVADNNCVVAVDLEQVLDLLGERTPELSQFAIGAYARNAKLRKTRARTEPPPDRGGMHDHLIERAEALDALVNGHPEHCAEAVPELTAMLSETNDPEVLIAIAHALGSARTDPASLALLPYVAHTDGRVRLAVAQALPGGVEEAEAKSRVADALIRLAEDESSDVRDWAVFGLGAILDLDTPEIRAVLRAHLFDSDIETRLEALVGLAVRGEPGVLTLIHDELGAETVERLAVEAARAFADPSLVAALRDLRIRWDEDPALLERAIRACETGERERWYRRSGAATPRR